MEPSKPQPVVLSLKQPITFNRPQWWSIQARYAMLRGGEEVPLKAGTWLLEIGPSAKPAYSPDQEPVQAQYLYRLPSGETVALNQPLNPAETRRVTNPQAISAMCAFRTLEQVAVETWGVKMEYVEKAHPPFKLIKCPLCGGTEFTSLDFASVWCETCSTSFRVRHTAGDPGFCVDADFYSSHWGNALYLLPKSEYLTLYMVFKNSSDPYDLSHTDWKWAKQAGCTPDKLKLTDETHPSLRPGLHACKLGDIYDWKFDGVAPTVLENSNSSSYSWGWKVEGEWWPACAYVPVSGLDSSDQQALANLANALARLDDTASPVIPLNQAVELLEKIARLPSTRVPVYPMTELPPLTALNREQDERYMLHHWLIFREEVSRPLYAYPIWLIVKPVLSSPPSNQTYPRHIEGWEVVHRNVCPVCGQRVSVEEMIIHADRVWQGLSGDHGRAQCLPHGRCHQVWERGWQPYLAALAATRQVKTCPKPTKDYYLALATQQRRTSKRQRIALVKLSSATLYASWCLTRLAAATGRPLSFEPEETAPVHFYTAELPANWVDCFTGQTFAEQNGVAVLNHSPWPEDTKAIVTDLSWGTCSAQGDIQWTANLSATGKRKKSQGRLETVSLAVKSLEHVVAATGVNQPWLIKQQAILAAWNDEI
ncbi:MAG: hypothetical protein BroJett011_43080 [Chloroflexota bacterium]|nr:MAG: hypothetical protein BroJett011_43080 [Chloroflexota bacterium]